MKYSWHGHSVVQLETIEGYKLIIDPFINGNATCDLKVEDVKVDYILLTHAHNDHVGDTLELARRNNATVIAMVELADFLSQFNIKTHGMNIGGKHKFEFGTVKFTPALHSSNYTYEDMSINLGLAAGIIVDDGVHKVYHAGDTALFSDMKYIKPVDLAFLPIGDNYTMGIDDALIASEILDPKLVIPIHYNTFPIIKQNPYEFINRLEDSNGFVPEIGELYNID